MSLTQEQARAVGARGKIIVSASAGSGKTHVMIERFAAILKSGEATVGEILAVTFTNKAASQMRERARKKLAEAYRSAGPEERAILKSRLDEFPLAEISTIHAFCARLVRTYFYLVGVDPRFTIVDGDQAEGRAVSARAADLAFERAYEEGGAWFGDLLSAYFRNKKDKRLRQTVLALYEKARLTADYAAVLQGYADGGTPEEESRDAAKTEFDRIVAYLTADLRDRAAEIARKAEGLIYFVSEHAPRALPVLQTSIAAAKRLAKTEDLFAFCALAQQTVFLRSCVRSRKDSPAALHAIGQTQEISHQIKALCAAAGEQKCDRSEEYRRYLDGRSRAAALAKLALYYDEEYTRLKREANILDYADLEHLAWEVLQNGEAAAAVRAKYRYIFVDEYQDVNPMQSAILEAVAGKEIFYVGDKKQAIYGFRGSRTRFFTQKENEFGGALPLDTNFRSSDAVLEAVNRVFTAAQRDYTCMTGCGRFGEHRGEVCVHTLAGTGKREPGQRRVYSVAGAAERARENAIAEQTLAIVEEECGRRDGLGKQWFDPDAGKDVCKQVSYGDIAVLVRKNSGAAGAIVRTLSERGIPVTASAEVNICDYFEVRLLLDWISYLDNAEQDIPLASAMLSAIGGFTESELAQIRLKAPAAGRPFRVACREYLQQAGPENALSEKLNAFFRLAEQYRALARVKTASEILMKLLADGLEAQIAAKGDGRGRLARVRRLVAESADCGDIHAFLRRLKDADYHIDLAESGGEDAVHVLTMHASKGLEFPVVILTELDAPFHGADRDEIMWTDEFGIAPKSFDYENKIFYETVTRRAADVFMRREEIEGERNLLYVAMTRAKYRLHLLLKESDTGDETDVSYTPTRAKRLSDFLPRARLREYECAPRALVQTAVKRHAFVYQSDPAIVRQIGEAARPYAYEDSTALPVKDSATGLLRRVHAEMPYPRDDEPEAPIADPDACFSAETGIAYHAFLEHVRFGEKVSEELGRMKKEGLLSAEQIALLSEERLEAILKIPCLTSLAGKEIRREQTFLVSLPAGEFEEIYGTKVQDGVVFQGAIDLLVRDEAGYRIIDYKFSSRSDGDLAHFYAPQIKLYRKAVAKIVGVAESDVRASIVNLVSGREIPV